MSQGVLTQRAPTVRTAALTGQRRLDAGAEAEAEVLLVIPVALSTARKAAGWCTRSTLGRPTNEGHQIHPDASPAPTASSPRRGSATG